MDRPRKLVAELVADVEVVRVEVDLEIKRVTVWLQRLDEEEPRRWEFELR